MWKRKGKGGIRESNKGMNMIRILYVHVWKYNNETPYFVQLIYANKN
jgi:hypothetical protein